MEIEISPKPKSVKKIKSNEKNAERNVKGTLLNLTGPQSLPIQLPMKSFWEENYQGKNPLTCLS